MSCVCCSAEDELDLCLTRHECCSFDNLLNCCSDVNFMITDRVQISCSISSFINNKNRSSQQLNISTVVKNKIKSVIKNSIKRTNIGFFWLGAPESFRPYIETVKL